MIYHESVPRFLMEAAATPTMERLKDVGMNCVCEYTSFPLFRACPPYSRYDHSMGVALIIWHFTADPVQAMAGLLHDAATPVFAHVVDFLNGDHLTQESTEAGIEVILEQDIRLQAVLKQYGINSADVSDYHRYPIADNPSPLLSADRLEYSLSNGVHYGFVTMGQVQGFYHDLAVGKNEYGQTELVFRTPKTALAFARSALACGKIYVCDQDRYAMQRLAELLKAALDMGILTQEDLYTREAPVMEKLRGSSLGPQWDSFQALHRVCRSQSPEPGAGWRRIPAKKRYIDPYIRGAGRVSAVFPDFREQAETFRNEPLTYWIRGE